MVDRNRENGQVLINVTQVAGMLGVAPRTVWRWRSEGKFPQPVQIGGSTRWKRDAVLDWIDAGCPAGESVHNQT